MKKTLFVSISSFILSLGCFAQTRETFETETVGSSTFTDNSQSFTITGSNTFDVLEFSNGGWNGTTSDNRFIDNTGSTNPLNDGATLTIKTTDGTDVNFLNFYLFISNNSLAQPSSGSLTVSGYIDGGATPEFTFTKTSGFSNVGTFSPNNGFTYIDISTEGASDFTGVNVDELRIVTTGDMDYLALDGLQWDVPVSCSMTASITSQTNLSCVGGSNGELTVTQSDGTANFSYVWSNGSTTNSSASSSNTISSLEAGTYTVTVTDDNGCTADASAIIEAVVNTWEGSTDSDWNTASNWSENRVPESCEDVNIPNLATSPIINEDSGTPATCNDITIDASATLTIAAGKAFTVSGDITNNGNLILSSDATGTATLLIDGSTSGSGTNTIQQYLAGGSRNYYVGSPVSGATGLVLDNSNESKFYHNASEQRYYALADGDALNVLQGYVYRSADVKTVGFTGTLNTGALSNNSLPRTGTDNAYRGYNLVSNPYPSFVDWTALTKTNLETTMWYRTHNGTSNVFDTYNATGSVGTNNNLSGAVTEFIPPMQAFWVRVDADGNTGQIAFNNTMRSHQTGVLRAPQNKQVFRFVVGKDGQTDEAVIVFDPNAQEIIEDYDSRKMYSNVTAQVSTVVEGADESDDLVINGLPFADGTSVPTKVTLKETGLYTLEATEQSGALADLNVYLEDKLTGAKVRFNAGDKYSFKGSTEDANRFVIHFDAMPLNLEEVNESAPIIFAVNKQLTVKVNEVNNAQLRIVNISGQLVQTQNINNSLTQINTNLPTGVYIVELNNGGELTREKVIIQ